MRFEITLSQSRLRPQSKSAVELGLLFRSRSSFRSRSGRSRGGSGFHSRSGSGCSHRSGTTASRSGIAAGGNRSTSIASGGRSTAGVHGTTATIAAGCAATVSRGGTAASAANLTLRSLAAGIDGGTTGRCGRCTAGGSGTTAAATLGEERLRVLGIEHRQGHNGHDDGSQRSELTTHLFFSQETLLKHKQIRNSTAGRKQLPRLCTT